MPVTAQLSRRFYDKFGDELTNELAEWFKSGGCHVSVRAARAE